MRTNEEFMDERCKKIEFIVDHIGSIDKNKLKYVLDNDVTLSALTNLYALALEGNILHPENTIQNVVTSDMIVELREQISQVQTDLIVNVEYLEKKIDQLKKK